MRTMHEQQEHNTQPTTRRKLILLVEDDEVHASMLYQLLTQETPHRVYFTSDGMTAWKFLQHFKPDLLLLDYRLPRLDGLELYERIRATEKLQDLPILMVSAAMPRREATERGITWLSKPFDIDDLLQTIESLLYTTNP